MKTLTSRERVTLALAHQPADRIPRMDLFWTETLDAWHTQGLSGNVDVFALREFLGFDIGYAGHTNFHAQPGYFETIAETAETITRRDGNGATLRWRKNPNDPKAVVGVPEHLNFSVKTRDDWDQWKKTAAVAGVGRRVDLAYVGRHRQWATDRSRWFAYAGLECFEAAKDVVGHETLCCLMAEDPEWARDLFETFTDMALAGLDYLDREGICFDGAWIFGDVAYNHGPFMSPAMYRELIMPSHRRQIHWFKDRGLPVIYHTDGNCLSLLPHLLEVGIDGLNPLEVKAGMDVRPLKEQYGDRLCFMGNIDVQVLLTNDRALIDREIREKVPVAKRQGGFIYHSDHSIPPGVRWDTYRFVMQTIDEVGIY